MQEFENKEEKLIDIKGTFEEFIQEEKPELSQEEAINAYKKSDIIEYKTNKKKKSTEDEEENEDDEHLKRVKKELLESLKRVDIMEKKIFEEKETKNNIKIKSGKQNTKDREKVIEQMKQKMQENDEKGRSREEWIWY